MTRSFRPMRAGLLACAAAFALPISSTAASADEVNVYTTRQPDLIQPLFDAFTEETGHTVNVLFGEEDLVERIAQEGANSPADVLITVDIGTLMRAEEAGVSQPIPDSVLDNVPEHMHGPDGHWVALSARARVVIASKERVEQDSIDYEDLADPEWKGRICTRPGQHPYNIALFASMVAHNGEAEAEEWLAGLRDNLAGAPGGNDRGQAQKVFAGECDLAIMNTYYLGLMANNDEEPEQKEWFEAIKVLFPNSGGRGTHVNVSGAILAANAPHEEAAVEFLDFLTSDHAQEIYAEVNHEYPVKEGVPLSDTVASWGEIVIDEVPLVEIGENRAKASELVDKVGYENGPSS